MREFLLLNLIVLNTNAYLSFVLEKDIGLFLSRLMHHLRS